MSVSVSRAAAMVLAAVALLAVVLLSAATPADAATKKIYACKAKNGTIRIVAKKTRCKKGQRKISWNVAGQPGKNGKHGANGKDGAAGQPQRVVKFSARLQNNGRPTTLFTAGGITYTFQCTFVLLVDLATLSANGPSGDAYSMGVFERPEGVRALPDDVKSDLMFARLGGGARPIATTTTLALSDGSVRNIGVWNVTVEGPSATTWIRATIDADSSCAIRGTAITIPN